MKLLKNENDVNLLNEAVNKCSGAVVVRSMDGREEFNLKSQLSRMVAIKKMSQDNGDEYEMFCMDRSDLGYMLNFYSQIRNRTPQAAIAT